MMRNIFLQTVILSSASFKIYEMPLSDLWARAYPFFTAQIIEAISTHKKITKIDATMYVKQLQQNGKYVQELWSITA